MACVAKYIWAILMFCISFSHESKLSLISRNQNISLSFRNFSAENEFFLSKLESKSLAKKKKYTKLPSAYYTTFFRAFDVGFKTISR